MALRKTTETDKKPIKFHDRCNFVLCECESNSLQQKRLLNSPLCSSVTKPINILLVRFYCRHPREDVHYFISLTSPLSLLSATVHHFPHVPAFSQTSTLKKNKNLKCCFTGCRKSTISQLKTGFKTQGKCTHPFIIFF